MCTEEVRKERFTFGKYKGKMIANVFITDEDYINWLSDDQYRFEVSDYWRKKIEEFGMKNRKNSNGKANKPQNKKRRLAVCE